MAKIRLSVADEIAIMNWTEFFHMGGYAFYVWTAWGLSVLVLIWQVLQPKLAHKRIKRDIARQLRREQTHLTSKEQITTSE